MAKAFGDGVRVVAHPVYSASGCEGARYRSAIVVRAASDVAAAGATTGTGVTGRDNGEPRGNARVAHAYAGSEAAVWGRAHAPVAGTHADVDSVGTLAELRGRRCVVNELDSNSGMNLLRAAVAPLAQGGRFFGSVVVSGSHLRSVEMVASGEADVASIDCVSFAHFQRLYPSLVSAVRVLSWTASSPSLPYITAGSAGDATVQALRAALADVFDDTGLAHVRDRLLLRGVDLEPTPGFGEVLALERQAAEGGYPALR